MVFVWRDDDGTVNTITEAVPTAMWGPMSHDRLSERGFWPLNLGKFQHWTYLVSGMYLGI